MLFIPPGENMDKWAIFKMWRRDQLAMCDWVFLPDCSLQQPEKDKIIAYRQFLKDAPDNYETVDEIIFPGYIGIVDFNQVYIDGDWSIVNL